MAVSKCVRTAALVAGAVVGAAAAEESFARRVRGRPGREVARLELVGLPGWAGGLGRVAGDGRIVVAFRLIDRHRRRTDVEAQFGTDQNGDGTIAAEEYRRATEDRADPRNTRSDRRPQLWTTAGGTGAYHAFSWWSDVASDLGRGRYELARYQVTDQGRLVPDPAYPGEFLFDTAQAGVRVRMRVVRRVGRTQYVGPWSTTSAFAVDNHLPPSMTIDALTPRDDGAMDVRWTAISPESEDANDNGISDDPDTNGDGAFQQQQMGAAFDWYVLQPGEDPAHMTPQEIDELVWMPCTRLGGEGDTDSFRVPAGEGVFGSPGGRQWTFVWDAEGDAGWLRGKQAILRARPVDAERAHGPWVRMLTPFTL